MFQLYILYSESLNRYYTGITSETVEDRLLKHNSSFYGSHYTSTVKDWELKCHISCDTYSVARKMELYIKRMKSKKFIAKIVNDSSEREKLKIIVSGS